MNRERLEVSVVVPVLNEESNLCLLYEGIMQALAEKYSYEIIFIDDGSTDKSFTVLSHLQKTDSKIRIIRFCRHFGQTAALSAGFTHARGNVIVAIDADLQNDPADIPKMITKLNEGFDVVSGWRKKRHDNIFTRLIPSRIANWLIAKITGVKLHDFGCTLKVYRKEVLANTKLYGEMHRFIPALASWKGARICEVPVNHRPRRAGKGKYGLGRASTVILDLITVKFLLSFSTRPIQLFGGWGLTTLFLSCVSGVSVVLMKIIKNFDMTGNPLLYLTIILLVVGIQFILMGLIAEMLVRTYYEFQDRPTYVIKELLDLPNREENPE